MQQLNKLTSLPMIRHSPITSFSSASQHTQHPSVQSTQHFMATVSTSSARPPQIGAITPITTGNVRVAGDIHTPAPHLQPFRPPAYMSATNLPSLPCNIPNQQVAATSSVLPRLQFQELMSMAAQVPAIPFFNMNQSCSNNRQSGIEGTVQPGTSNSSLSAVQLLRDVHRKNSELGLLPHSTDSGSKGDALNLCNTQTLASLCSIRTSSTADSGSMGDALNLCNTQTLASLCGICTSSAASTDIICLSDDDD